MSPAPTSIHHTLTHRLEDLRFMADTGETHTGAAQRLGLRVDALQAWLLDHDRATWTRLVANSRALGHGARLGSLRKAIA